MQCPECQFENPEKAKFCNECGCSQPIACPSCKSPNPPASKFCNECGFKMAMPEKDESRNLSIDEKLDKLQRYLPKGVTEKILAQRGRIEGERKHITVLFCDLVGFTPMVEKLGHEAAYTLMDQVYEILIHKVHEYEGTVNEFTGDGIMALFGAPIALESAPQRAILSSLSIHREMTKFKDRMEHEIEGLPSIKMRIGIHTGPVVVGTLGNDLRVEFKAVGDTVNLASRMEGLAEPGTTYVSDETFKHTEGFFRFEALGQKQVKGIKKPVKIFRVIAASSMMTRFDVSAERGLTPLVGRERELGLLIDAFERAKSGKGQAVSIISEAGLGKSRLLYEFRKSIANENITFMEGKCTSFTKSIAYYPVKEILKSNFNIQDAAADVTKKVKDGLSALDTDETDTLPFLLELLAVKDSGIEQYQLSPDGLRNKVIEALIRIVLKGSELKPLVMAFEDLHWMDKSSIETLRYLLESIPGSRILLLFTFRPEFTQTWKTRSYHSQIMLDRLAMLESIRMATHLLNTQFLDDALEALILEKTEGVPFFIEELIKSLIELRIVDANKGQYGLSKDFNNVLVPTTIQDIIMARVDMLPDMVKTILQTGSAIEREFSFEMIKAVTGINDNDLFPNLSYAKNAELIYERGVFPKTTYIFKHALTQDVIYQSILAKKKKSLHGKIAECIEDLQADNIEDQYGVLAEHFFLNEKFEQALKYSKLAAKKAQKTGSLIDAIYFTEKSISALEKLPQSDEIDLKLIDTRTILAIYQVQLNHLVEAKNSVEPIIELAKNINYKKRLAQILFVVGTYESFVNEDYDEASKQLERSLKISEEVSDVISIILGNQWIGWNLGWDCQFERTYQHLGKALEINEMFDNTWGIAALKSCLGVVHYWNGMVDSAYNFCKEAITIADESRDIYSRALSYTNYGVACYGKRYLKEAIKYIESGSEFCGRINYYSWDAIANFYLAEIYFDIGDLEHSKAYYEKSIFLFEKETFCPSLLNLAKLGVERVESKKPDYSINLRLLHEYYNKNRPKLLKGWICRYIGEILLNCNTDYLSEANYWIEMAIEANKRNKMMLLLAQDYKIYSGFFNLQGNRAKSKEMLDLAITNFSKCGADGWIKNCEEELATFS